VIWARRGPVKYTDLIKTKSRNRLSVTSVIWTVTTWGVTLGQHYFFSGRLRPMRMLQTSAIPCRLTWRGIFLFATFLLALQLLFTVPTFSQPQPRVIPTLLVTPSATTILVGETSALSAVDETGKPLANVRWSTNSDVVTLQEQNGEVFLQGRAPGQAVLTATANHQSDTAVISVLGGQKLAPATRGKASFASSRMWAKWLGTVLCFVFESLSSGNSKSASSQILSAAVFSPEST
jgi:hypothetical protein